jgi:hypothetical protein
MLQTVMALLFRASSSSGQRIESGYGGEGKSVVPHSYAAIVTWDQCCNFVNKQQLRLPPAIELSVVISNPARV